MSEELPKDWKWVKLGEVCNMHQGYGFPKDLQGITDEEYPFYKVGDISKNVKAGFKYLEFCDNYIDKKVLATLKAKPYPANTIVFAKIGEALKLNRRAIIKKQGIVDNNAIGLKAIDKFCDDLFLYYFLSTVKLEDYSRATTVPSVRKSDIEEINFPLPPKETQQQIVSKIEELFSEVDKGIEEIKTAQQQLKVYRQAVLKWAFRGKLTNNEVKEGGLPKGWRIETLGRTSDMCLGKMLDKQKNKGLLRPYLGNINVRWGEFQLEDLKLMAFEEEELERFRVRKGDLVICEGGEPGRCAIWKNDGATVMIQKALHRVRVLNNVDARYVYHYLSFAALNGSLTKYFTGTTIKHLTGKELRKVEFPMPSLVEQQQIVQEIESRLSVCDKIEETITNSLKQAEALRQSILKKAFEGKLVN